MAEETKENLYTRFNDLMHVELTPLEFTFLSKLLYAWNRFGRQDTFFAGDEDLAGIGGKIKSSATLAKLKATLAQKGFFQYRRGFKIGKEGIKTRYKLLSWAQENAQALI